MMGKIEVINSHMTLKLITKYLSMLQTDKDLRFSESCGLSQWNLIFGDIFCCLLLTFHQKGKKRAMDQVI